jgi:hypothetical protein
VQQARDPNAAVLFADNHAGNGLERGDFLALAAAAGGFVISRVALEATVTAVTRTMLPELVEFGQLSAPAADWRVAVFLLGGAFAATVLFGLAPAPQATRIELVRTMRHRQIGILVEQLPDTLQRCRARRNEKRAPGEEEVDAGRASALNAGQEVSGFSQHRLGRHHTAGPVREGTTTLQVVRLAAIEERDQCTGIEQQLSGHASTPRARTDDVAPPGRGLPTTTSR